MILSDNEIQKRLADLDFKAANPNFPFDPDTAVQPCSIDLRLSDVIWKPRFFRSMFRSIDFVNNRTMGAQIADAFNRTTIASTGYLLKPGEFLLGRTYEWFKMPEDLHGQLIGRSSIGRLGLSVVAPANFINPGWQGHMPLMIINHSPFFIRLHAHLGIAQLQLHNLSSTPTKQYGDTLGSKYLDDDGGPSKFWLDGTVKALRENLHANRTNEETEAVLTAFSGSLDDATRSRFVRKIEKARAIPDAKAFLDSFVDAEAARPTYILLAGAAASIVLGSVAWQFAGWKLGLGLVIGVAILAWAAWLQRRTTISVSELRAFVTEAMPKENGEK